MEIEPVKVNIISEHWFGPFDPIDIHVVLFLPKINHQFLFYSVEPMSDPSYINTNFNSVSSFCVHTIETHIINLHTIIANESKID